MDKQRFIAASPAERVREVNKLLQDHDPKEISTLVGIPSSSFSKLMREGDYLYHQADKQYYPFVRSEEERLKHSDSGNSNEITFIKQHADTLRKMIQQFEEQGLLLLDKRIYSREATFANKSIRMNREIYEDFTRFCEEFYPHFKNQDIVAQALLDTMNRYRPTK